MHTRHRPRRPRAALTLTATAVAITLAGCQGYEREPLDLAAHAAAFHQRAAESEPISRFAQRLAESNAEAPARFNMVDGLSPAEGEVLALFYNADLRLARLDAGIALAAYDTAGLWQDPQFGFDAAEVLSPAGVFEYGLTLGLTIPVSGRLEIEEDRAGVAYEAELRRIVDAEWTLRTEVRTAWAEWTAAAQRASLYREVVSQVRRITDITDGLESAGELTRVESRLIRAQAVSARADLLQAQRDETESRIRLLGLMGLPATADLTLIPGFPPIPDAPPTPSPDNDARLITANTTLAIRRAEYRVAEETLRLEVRKQYPDITIAAGYGNEGDDRLLLGLSLPIPILNANRAGIADARARRERARAAAETTYEQLSRSLASAHARLHAAREQTAAYEAELIPMLDEQSLEVERLAELGEVDTLLLLETVTRGAEARSTLLDLRTAEIRAANDITRLLGPDPTRHTAPAPSPAPASEAAPMTGAPTEEPAR